MSRYCPGGREMETSENSSFAGFALFSELLDRKDLLLIVGGHYLH